MTDTTKQSPTASHRQVIRDVVNTMAPFASPPVEQDLREQGFDGPILRLHLNECPYPPSPKVVEAIREAAAGVNRYPDSWWRGPANILAERLDVPRHRIVFGNGSDQLLNALGDLTLEDGHSAIVPEPSFHRYNLATEMQGAELIKVPLNPQGANDVEAMLAAIRPNTPLIFTASPNNPTGGMLTGQELHRLADGVPDSCLLVLDEAYHEFAQREDGPDGLAAIRHREGPWVVLRTLSKAYGLAGLRIGYAICGSDEIAEGLNKLRQAFQVNAIALAAAEAALGDMEYGRWLVEQVAAERDRVMAEMRGMGLSPLPSVGNFITADVGRPAAPLVGAIARRGIMIGTIRTPTPGYDTYIRLTVGTREEMDALLLALAEELAAQAEQ
ncbi:MAG: histidinol-phosphate transaminase [Alphaproteobacteria bacterium]|jgi:histidinol-phosphate aminotransferase|nr:histidinol-phosphate transaminase [Alphaproteobacteria bacterium]MDP6567813.1 histidinol-phosphate transaminase [Alphaproteobacteria bacterium]MDP6815514.1 histidinol-phosphate transaminase [Alphaproteobacteria bacterium]